MSDESVGQAMPGWVKVTAIGVLAAGVVAYVLIAALGDEGKWGPRGDAVGPFAALFNAGALFAALWAVHLQRTELALQRQELRETREEMVEQRKQFERTARAQEKLADSQASLATEQQTANEVAKLHAKLQEQANQLARNANRRAAALELAQRGGTVASLFSARVAIASLVGEPSRHAAPAKADLEKLFAQESQVFEQLKAQVASGEAE